MPDIRFNLALDRGSSSKTSGIVLQGRTAVVQIQRCFNLFTHFHGRRVFCICP